MAMATSIDIEEIKTAIDTIKTSVSENTSAIARQSDRIDSIIRLTEANANAINALTQRIELGFLGVNGKIEIGFANVDTKLTKVETELTKLEGKINVLDIKSDGQIEVLDTRFDERTNAIRQRVDGKELAARNIYTGITVAFTGGMLLAFAKYLFFGTFP